MSSPHVPKYQAIYARLREQILSGELPPGSQLPRQQELADSFRVTLMTLRQAVAALESDGLVRAAHGKGTFVADRPVDIALGNLSSFAEVMRAAGVEVATELLETFVVAAAEQESAATALDVSSDLRCVVRLRSSGAVPFSLQRSYFDDGLGLDDFSASSNKAASAESLYGAIEAATGWLVAEAKESITAVALDADDAQRLDAAAGQPALLSIRTSINQFGQPFLYDEALLVGDRCTIAADRTSDRLSLRYDVE